MLYMYCYLQILYSSYIRTEEVFAIDVTFAVEFILFAIEFIGFALEFVVFSQEFVIITLTAINQPLIARWIIFAMENTTCDTAG